MTRRSLGIAGPVLLLGGLVLDLRALTQPVLCQAARSETVLVVLSPVLFLSGVAVTAITRRYIGVIILMGVLSSTLYVYAILRSAAICSN